MRTGTMNSGVVTIGSRRIRSVAAVSMGAGKSAFPRIRSNSVAYVNCFNSNGTAEVVTEVRSVRGGYEIRVGRRGAFQIQVESWKANPGEILDHVFQDLQAGRTRLYRGESASWTVTDREGKSRAKVEDGLSMLLRGLERLLNTKIFDGSAPVSRDSGVRSSFPTLEKVARAEGKGKCRPSSGRYAPSGMALDSAGGVRSPSMTECIRRERAAAERNLEMAEAQFEAGNNAEAELRFQIAAEYEQRASQRKTVMRERRDLLRERVEAAKAAKTAQA